MLDESISHFRGVRSILLLLFYCLMENQDIHHVASDLDLHCLPLTLLQDGLPGRVAQSVGHLTRKSEVLGLMPSLATYFCFSFH